MKNSLAISIVALIIFWGCTKVSDAPNSPNLPTVTTTSLSNITDSSAVSGGTITNNGGSGITARGVVYSTDSLPTLSSSLKTINGSGTGSFVSNLKGLAASTKHYVRAYATNSVGTAYGNSVTFKTNSVQSDSLPVVSTDQVFFVNDSAAGIYGNIIYSGGSPITASGIVYSTDSLPTLANSFNSPNNTFSPGIFGCFLQGLSELTTYYARAYATNSKGTSYGNQLVFQTPKNPNEFIFFKDQYTDTTFGSRIPLETFPHNSAVFTNNLILPQGIFMYVQIDSVYGVVNFGNVNDTTKININLQQGDTVHIMNDGNSYQLYTPPYYDNWGNYMHDSQCWYSVKIGGIASTPDNTYYCNFYLDFATTNVFDFWRFYTDTRHQCNFDH